MREEFSVGRVINGLHTGDTLGEMAVPLLHVGDEGVLGGTWSGNDNLRHGPDLVHDLVEELVVVSGMTRTRSAGLVVDAPGSVLAPDLVECAPLAGEADHPAMLMVEPDDGMRVGHCKFLSATNRRPRR